MQEGIGSTLADTCNPQAEQIITEFSTLSLSWVVLGQPIYIDLWHWQTP